jgi:hypothetical protein
LAASARASSAGAWLVVSGCAVWSAEIVIVPSFCCHYSFPVSSRDLFRIQRLMESWRSCTKTPLLEDDLAV